MADETLSFNFLTQTFRRFTRCLHSKGAGPFGGKLALLLVVCVALEASGQLRLAEKTKTRVLPWLIETRAAETNINLHPSTPETGSDEKKCDLNPNSAEKCSICSWKCARSRCCTFSRKQTLLMWIFSSSGSHWLTLLRIFKGTCWRWFYFNSFCCLICGTSCARARMKNEK